MSTVIVVVLVTSLVPSLRFTGSSEPTDAHILTLICVLLQDSTALMQLIAELKVISRLERS